MSHISERLIHERLIEFKHIGLEELNQARLMERIETKYMVSLEQLAMVLDAVKPNYHILKIDNTFCFKYQNTYFDTEELLFYHMHQEGSPNRFKVRTRHYLDSKLSYLEVKVKNNLRTNKKRIQLACDKVFDIQDFSEFLTANDLPADISLVPCLGNSYQRITFVDPTFSERLTIDTGIRFDTLIRGYEGEACMEDVAIIELKQLQVDQQSPIFQTIQSMGIQSGSFSKYCMGIQLTNKLTPVLKPAATF